MSKETISFDELIAKRNQREADRYKVGFAAVPGTDKALQLETPGNAVILELYGELAAAADAASALRIGNRALYHCCPALQDSALHEALDTKDDPMRTISELFSIMEQDDLGTKALQFLGLMPAEFGGNAQPVDTVKN